MFLKWQTRALSIHLMILVRSIENIAVNTFEVIWLFLGLCVIGNSNRCRATRNSHRRTVHWRRCKKQTWTDFNNYLLSLTVSLHRYLLFISNNSFLVRCTFLIVVPVLWWHWFPNSHAFTFEKYEWEQRWKKHGFLLSRFIRWLSAKHDPYLCVKGLLISIIQYDVKWMRKLMMILHVKWSLI